MTTRKNKTKARKEKRAEDLADVFFLAQRLEEMGDDHASWESISLDELLERYGEWESMCSAKN